MQNPSILFTSSFGIIFHLQLNKWVSKFSHFLWVSTIIGKTLNEIQYSLFNNNVIFTHLSICTQGCSPSCNYFLYMFHVLLCLIYRPPLLQHCFLSFNLFHCLKLFPQYFRFRIRCPTSQLQLLHILHYDFKFCGLRVSTCCCSFLHIYSSIFNSSLVSLWYTVHSMHTLFIPVLWYTLGFSLCTLHKK